MTSPSRRKSKKVDPTASLEIDFAAKKKTYPSISDYYQAFSSEDKPVQYQYGLSNYSSVQLGDDRISFTKSLSQVVYQDTEQQNAKIAAAAHSTVTPAQKIYSEKQRKNIYAEANDVVGLDKIHEMEQMMRDKLQQRTKTGPFQLRKTFKYFDRDGSGGIDYNEFQRALELMGFQFTDVQLLALFARYDETCTGEVNYNDFVEKVMEADFQKVDFQKSFDTSGMNSLDNMLSSAFHLEATGESKNDNQHSNGFNDYEDDSDINEDELESFKRAEMNKLFHAIDKDRNEFIDKIEVVKLLHGFGRKFDQDIIDEGFSLVDKDQSGQIDFEEFYEWFKSIDHHKSK